MSGNNINEENLQEVIHGIYISLFSRCIKECINRHHVNRSDKKAGMIKKDCRVAQGAPRNDI